MNIPQPTITGQQQYSYELDPHVMVGLTPADTAATFLGEVHHVSVFINSYQGQPRPTTITARTLTGRLAFAAVPLDGFPTGPNDDPRLLDVFADLIADAEQRHAQAAARAAHPAYQAPPSRVPGQGHSTATAAPPVGATASAAVADFTTRALKPTHLCQHGNLVHPCACTSSQDHSRPLCQGVRTDA